MPKCIFQHVVCLVLPFSTVDELGVTTFSLSLVSNVLRHNDPNLRLLSSLGMHNQTSSPIETNEKYETITKVHFNMLDLYPATHM